MLLFCAESYSSNQWSVLRAKQFSLPVGLLEVFEDFFISSIIGCDYGFGHRLAQKLSNIGFRVYATVLNTDSVGAQDLRTNFNNVIVMRMDVTNETQVNESYDKIKNDLDHKGLALWAVVNNAGTITVLGPSEWGTLDNYTKSMDVNLFGAVRVTRKFLPLIRASKGRITNVSSLAGRYVDRWFVTYGMAKASLIAYSETLRKELLKFGVNVSLVEPAYYRTQMTEPDNLSKLLENNWNQTTKPVKKSYGSYKRELSQLVSDIHRLSQMSGDIDEAVDDMLDSVVNTWPKALYRPMHFYLKVFHLAYIISPSLVRWCLKQREDMNKVFTDGVS